MAYTPVSGNKKGGYVPVSKKRAVVPATPKAKTLPPAKLPFAATKTGIAVNTVLGLPKAAADVLREIPRGIAGTAAQGAAAVMGMKQEDVSLDPATMGPAGKLILGDKKIEPAKEGAALLDLIPGIKEETAKKYGPALYAGLTLTDFLTVPGKKTAIIETIKTVDNLAGARRLLKDAGVADETIDALKLDSKAVAAKTDVEAEAILKEATEATTPKVPAPTVTPTAPVKVVDEAMPALVKQDVPTAPVRVADDVVKAQTKEWTSNWVINSGKATPPPVEVVNELSKFKPTEPITLYRGIKGDSPESFRAGVQAWTKDKSVAERFSVGLKMKGEKPGRVVSKVFGPDEIIADISNIPDEYINDLVPKDFRTEGEVLIKAPNFSLTQEKSNLPPLPKLPTSQSPDQVINSALERYRVGARKPETVLPEVAKAAKVPTSPGGLMLLAGKLLTPISSRLERINPKLKEVLRRFEYNVAQNTHKDSARILPLLNATKQLTKEESLIFDLARKNGDADVINAIAKKYGFEKELQESQRVLDEIYDRAKEVGIEIPYRENYFPRVVKNPEKYVAYLRSKEDWSEIQAMVEKHAADKGKKYTDLTSEEIAGIVNNYLRGFGNKIDLAKPGFAKQRSVEVIDETLNDFYESSDAALSTYIIRMNDEIEGRRFFGKALKTSEKVLNTEDSIGAYVMDLIQKGELKPQFEREVSDILKARFARGKMNGALDAYRNIEYISTMGSPISAITQIADVAWSIYDNGGYNTLKSLGKSTFGKRANRITKEDLGIEQITQEFQNASKTGKALDKVFKLVGMERLDRLGKETLVNAEFLKFKSQAKRNDPKLLSILNRTFDPQEVPQVMKEFAEGKITENTKLVLFNKLLDFQPVAKSEMPQVYLEHPNGRIFYMLKSFTLKQYDIFRREAIDKIASGDKKKAADGMKNLVLLAGAFTMANATSDEIKDLILGRETPPSDRVIDNFWRLLGASKYDVYKARQDGVGQTVLKKILFPTSFIDRLSADVKNTIENKEYEKGPLKGQKYKLESTQSIPVGGKLYYWWFGRGAQKEAYKKGGSSTSGTALPTIPALPTLPKLPKLPSL